MEIISYKELAENELKLPLFSKFNRYQDVKKCWRKVNGEWVLKEKTFTEQWGANEYKYLIECLQNTIKTGGTVFGAFKDGVLVGFASLENDFFGLKREYLQLSSIHISYDCRGRGIGKRLFALVSEKARAKGGQKLYISAHSAEETQAFYKALGCVEAVEYNDSLQAREPCDCQLEFDLRSCVRAR